MTFRLHSRQSEPLARTKVLRPAVVLPGDAARDCLVALTFRDVRAGGCWAREGAVWRRYGSLDERDGLGVVVGALHVGFCCPTDNDITLFRVAVTSAGAAAGWTVDDLCEEVLGYAGLSLPTCTRAILPAPPAPRGFPAGPTRVGARAPTARG